MHSVPILERYGLLQIESGFSCDSTECQHVCRGVAAKTVGAVNAAGDFAGYVEAGNYAAIDIKHLSFRIDEQSAHRMVNRRRSGRSVEGGFFNLAVKELASELCIFLSVYHGIEFGYRFFKVGWRHAKLFGEICQSICFVDATKLHERFTILGKGIYRLHRTLCCRYVIWTFIGPFKPLAVTS